MEKSNIENKKIEVVNKGVFYYIGFLFLLPFKALFFLGKLLLNYLKLYFSWYKEHLKYNKRTKDLNKILSINRLDDEII